MPARPRRSPASTLAAALALGASLAAAAPARANERHFTYTYESGVLPAGAAELEPWTTWRVGRDHYYSAFDLRLEFEFAITSRLQTALYVNSSAETERVSDAMTGAAANVSSFEFEGVSSEWKLKLLDPVADPVGLALYGELGLGPSEYELEAKVILDKRVGNVLFAGNAVFEIELEPEAEPTETELELEMGTELHLAAGYFVSEHVMIGLEVRNETSFAEGELEASTFFAGPTVSWAAEGHWVALTVQAQLGTIHGGDAAGQDGPLDLDESEYVNARAIFGFDL